MLLPGGVRGVYELLRRPVIYQAKNSSSSSTASPASIGGGNNNFVLKDGKGRAILSHISLGLEVLPQLSVDLFPRDSGAGFQTFLVGSRDCWVLLARLSAAAVVAPVYVVVMAVWFPFLPIIQ